MGSDRVFALMQSYARSEGGMILAIQATNRGESASVAIDKLLTYAMGDEYTSRQERVAECAAIVEGMMLDLGFERVGDVWRIPGT